MTAAVAALGFHPYKLHPYSELVEPAVVTRAYCHNGQAVRIMIANVKRRNDRAEPFLDQVAAADPDRLLVMETDAWWDEQLSALRDQFRHRIQSIPEDHAFYGMHLLSTERRRTGSATRRRNDRIPRSPAPGLPWRGLNRRRCGMRTYSGQR